jgi:hypothetical protein
LEQIGNLSADLNRNWLKCTGSGLLYQTALVGSDSTEARILAANPLQTQRTGFSASLLPVEAVAERNDTGSDMDEGGHQAHIRLNQTRLSEKG